MRALLVLFVALFLGACATTQQGQSVERFQYADITTTAIALTNSNVSEANPLGLYLLPIKVLAGKLVDKLPCEDRRSVASGINGVTGMAVANNLLVIAGVSNPLLFGILIGSGVWYVTDVPKCL